MIMCAYKIQLDFLHNTESYSVHELVVLDLLTFGNVVI